METKIPSVLDIRNIIESIKEEKYRCALMYQFLVGASISEVTGKYAPRGVDAVRASFKVENDQYPAVLFIIRNKRQEVRGKYRVCALPLGPDYEPWTKQVFDWFEKKRDKKTFDFCNRSLSRIADREFKGLFWPKAEYRRGTGEIIERRRNPFRSEDLRKLRKKNLREFYYFDEVGLALFGAWNEPVLDVRKQVEIERVLSTEINIDDVSSLIDRANGYFEDLLRYFDQMGEEITSIHRQLREGADLSRARGRAFDIIRLVENINVLGQWHFNAHFFNENMMLIYEILSDCKDKTDFTSKIASLSPLFEVNLDPLKKLVIKPEDKGSIKLINNFLVENKITHDPKMIETWFNIQALRTMIVHSKIDAKRYVDLLIFFGEPPKLEPNYSSLWDNILDKFIFSLREFLNILNTLET